MSREVDPTFCDSGIHMATTNLLVSALKGKLNVQTVPNVGTNINIEIPIETTTTRYKSLSGSVEKFCFPIDNKHERKLNAENRLNVSAHSEPAKKNELRSKSLDSINWEACNIDSQECDELSKVMPVSSSFTPRFLQQKGKHMQPKDKESTTSVVHPDVINLIEGKKTGSTDSDLASKISPRKVPEAKDEEIKKEVEQCDCERILIVDDNALNLFVVESMMQRFGFKCKKVTSLHNIK